MLSEEIMTIYLSLLVALIGLVTYAITNHPKLGAIAFAMFQCGLLAFLLQTAPHTISAIR